MDFNLSKEQELLRDGLGRFLTTRYDLEKSRTAAKLGAGWQPDVWRGFADELGILGATLPESVGGMGGGAVELMVIAEELGRALVIEPFVGTVVVGGGLLQRAGGAPAEAVLERIAAGTAVVALAAEESAKEPARAARDGDGWLLNGAKVVVPDAPLATHLLITAQVDAEGAAPQRIALFLTEFDTAAPPDRPDSPDGGLCRRATISEPSARLRWIWVSVPKLLPENMGS